jgi:hypothetical protein
MPSRGDGTNIVINDRTLPGLSAIYSTVDILGFVSRMIVNAQGQLVSPFPGPVNYPEILQAADVFSVGRQAACWTAGWRGPCLLGVSLRRVRATVSCQTEQLP